IALCLIKTVEQNTETPRFIFYSDVILTHPLHLFTLRAWQMLAATLYFLALGPSHTPNNLNTKEGRLHKHLLKWNGVGSPYAYALR
ncbi:MAG: hypothetical protein AAGJ80_09135, partial [Cyanobacteria bacterium J06553_1]